MSISAADTAWVLISSALVMLMVPGVALFYGGMVQRKNVVSTLGMSFAILALVGLLWVVYGYSLSFGPDVLGFIGGLNWFGLSGVGQEPSEVYATTVPHLAFMAFQGMFAIISVALITGAVVERMKFSALLIFSVLWFTLVYAPVAHSVWAGGGWLARLGALDFAGGTVVHVNAGISALALAMVLGPRRGFKKREILASHHIPLTALGAALLWFGWFGFNGGSALTSGGLASSAFVATQVAAAAAAFGWMLISWLRGRPNLLGIVTGAVAGLVAITPAAGFVTPIAAIPIGLVAAVIGHACMSLRNKLGVDEALDVWAVHGMCGTWGGLATGIFASLAVNAAGADGLLAGSPLLLLKQVASIAVVYVYAFSITYGIAWLLRVTVGLRVREEEELVGLDIAQHGERAYGGVAQ